MKKSLEGKAAVITGSSQGMGRAVALSMAAEGAKVIVNNRKPNSDGPDAEKVAQEIRQAGGIAIPVYGDAAEEEVCKKLVDTCVKEFGSIDILVNNAGIPSGDDLAMFDEAYAIKLFRTCLCGSVYTCREAIPHMQKNGYGRIINTSSITALQWSWRYTTTYTSVKSAVYGFTRLLARSYGHDGITANVVLPDVNTRLTDVVQQPVMEQAMTGWYLYGTMSEKNLKHCLNLPNPEVCAAFYSYLASPAAANINGKTFKVSDDIELVAEPELIRFFTRSKNDPVWTVEDFENRFESFMEGIAPCPPFQQKEGIAAAPLNGNTYE